MVLDIAAIRMAVLMDRKFTSFLQEAQKNFVAIIAIDLSGSARRSSEPLSLSPRWVPGKRGLGVYNWLVVILLLLGGTIVKLLIQDKMTATESTQPKPNNCMRHPLFTVSTKQHAKDMPLPSLR